MSMKSQWQIIEEQLDELVQASRRHAAFGAVPRYIPELASAPAEALGITICDLEGRTVSSGDCGLSFTMQSISKVFTLLLALMDNGEDGVFARVGMEPSGDDFNSMLKLELVEPGKPFNPLINAGAIAVTALIHGDTPEAKSARIAAFFRTLAGGSDLTCNESVYLSEKRTAHRNRSLAYFLMDNDVLDPSTDVEELLDVYFRHCAIEATCADLARMALVLASGGIDPDSGAQLVPRRYVQIAKTFMSSCGMYNASGEFAIQAGIPAKSGVAGGILALVPGRYGIGVIGPALNRKGNSTAGVHLLERLSQAHEWSMF
ncbi:glutaminase A [Paenibacillus sp. IB182496]|uniref:Glutaminase n=1 Tax=Paenibacillus sabuli TaxID=2772509 RepID=A0A927BTE9_9BACL|nr:glutaminase A [Paenibacillus sabuli]MBD2846462.1 glutaminase A [Paenibacillus sabuli]